jgi:hypothetical protein
VDVKVCSEMPDNDVVQFWHLLELASIENEKLGNEKEKKRPHNSWINYGLFPLPDFVESQGDFNLDSETRG